MKSLTKIAGFNLVAILVYSAIIRLASAGESEKATSILLTSAFVVGLHVFVCIVITLRQYAHQNKESGKAWLASAGIVLLVGFSVCLGNANL